ncbi:uncharacterized protein EHS24_001641 [Apiotrichum porosum]|uniref:DUF3224 domain-containing protein n=1 Tax=Apiotrichum porosum TaxID=105984 RepID=A0A427XIX7_9TREE|nr:uncharacterized protein EHS24_001641 [Apiotrichum porosum]RSH78742.1 hypothetical protein EHS24_001641 [Apiotrichum porosum]
MSPTKISTPFQPLSWNTNMPAPDVPASALVYKFARMELKFDTDAMRGKGLAPYLITIHPGTEQNTEEFCTSSYDGQVLFEGEIMGRTGTVAIYERGTTSNGDVNAEWVIATGTASGQLKGIKGHGGYALKAGNGGKTIAGHLEVDFDS